jgi:hypothetical protein
MSPLAFGFYLPSRSWPLVSFTHEFYTLFETLMKMTALISALYHCKSSHPAASV